MLMFGIDLAEGSKIANLSVDAGTSDPVSNPDAGELFFRTDTQKLRVYDGSSWGDVGGAGGGTFSGALVSVPAGDPKSVNHGAVTFFDTFTNEIYDEGGWHDNVTNPSRITVPSGVSYATLSVSIEQVGTNSAGYRDLIIFKNGAAYQIVTGHQLRLSEDPPGTTYGLMFTTAALPVTTGDYFELRMQQTSGVSLTFYASMGMQKVG